MPGLHGSKCIRTQKDRIFPSGVHGPASSASGGARRNPDCWAPWRCGARKPASPPTLSGGSNGHSPLKLTSVAQCWSRGHVPF